MWFSRVVPPEYHIGYFRFLSFIETNTWFRLNSVYLVMRTPGAHPYVDNELNHCHMVPR
jgi:hypothetical protein